MQHGSMLKIVTLRNNLKYVAWGIPGALPVPFLESDCLDKLEAADRAVRQATDGRGFILVWDALRTMQTQRYIYDEERRKLAERRADLDDAGIDALLGTYVRPPRFDPPPPHTTGGAVDVTIMIDGVDNVLGDFDDFSDFGRSDYFDRNEARTQSEAEAKHYREILSSAMQSAGFVGIPEEWWHWEYGTRLWAEERDEEVVFDTIRLAPEHLSIAESLPHLDSRFVVSFQGVAPAFPSPLSRAKALSGVTQAFYYVRTRHPNEHQLREKFAETLEFEDVLLLPSGLSAVASTTSALAKKSSTVVVDSMVYYESRRSMLSIGKALGWDIKPLDLTSADCGDKIKALSPALVFADHPRNWFLTNPDLVEVKRACEVTGSISVVDTSLQPLQPLQKKGLADLTLMSLTKYPSMGETIAGLVGGSAELVGKVRRYSADHGLVVSPEAAATVLRHFATLEDRLVMVSQKAERIADRLRTLSQVDDVWVADLEGVSGFSGGQICVKFRDSAFAASVESIVGWNCGSKNFPLTLACTFGASFTTFEHFVPRQTNDMIEGKGFIALPSNLVRLGIGHEPEDAIVSAFEFCIHAATTNSHD